VSPSTSDKKSHENLGGSIFIDAALAMTKLLVALIFSIRSVGSPRWESKLDRKISEIDDANFGVDAKEK
jgi:hypothetical protein